MRFVILKSNHRPRGGVVCACAVLLGLTILGTGWCRAEGVDRILFLHLKLKEGMVTSVGAVVKPGHVKTLPASQKRGEVYLELVSTNGTALWSDVIGDPAIQRFEYEDPDHPGTLKSLEVRMPEAEFQLRVPFYKKASQLKLYRLEKPAHRAEAALPAQTKRPLGAIDIPATEDKP